MLRTLRTAVPSLRLWQSAACADGLFQRGAYSTEATSRVIDLASDKEHADALSAASADAHQARQCRADGGKAVVDYTAKWCAPCNMIAPIYNKFSTEYTDVKFYRVDIDREEIADSVAEACVSTVPTFTFHKDGERVSSFSGADPTKLRSSLEELQD